MDNNQSFPKEQYKILKGKVFEAEKTNRSYINAYEYKKDWWQIGGISALYYFYDLSHKNGHKTVNKKQDRDWHFQWKTGCITFNSRENLELMMKKAGLKAPIEVEPSWIRFPLPKPLKKETIKRLIDTDKHFQEANEHLIMPRNTFPKFFTLLREVSREFSEIFRKLDEPKREIYGSSAVICLEKSKLDYIQMANGKISETLFFEKMVERVDYVLAWILATSDYQIFTLSAMARITRSLIDLKIQSQDILFKNKDTNSGVNRG